MRDIKRDREPNWKLAFGSGAFLLVWLLGLAADLPLDVALFRAAVAAALGSVMGVVVGMTLGGLKRLAHGDNKGGRVDFTVPAAADELVASVAAAEQAEATRTVPQAASDPFTPIDYKQAAKHVQGMVNE